MYAVFNLKLPLTGEYTAVFDQLVAGSLRVFLKLIPGLEVETIPLDRVEQRLIDQILTSPQEYMLVVKMTAPVGVSISKVLYALDGESFAKLILPGVIAIWPKAKYGVPFFMFFREELNLQERSMYSRLSVVCMQ